MKKNISGSNRRQVEAGALETTHITFNNNQHSSCCKIDKKSEDLLPQILFPKLDQDQGGPSFLGRKKCGFDKGLTKVSNRRKADTLLTGLQCFHPILTQIRTFQPQFRAETWKW